MAKELRTLSHGMLLDGKAVMDNAMCDLERIRKLIPECLHKDFDKAIEIFEDTLCECDVAHEHKELRRI